jgi:hypothetical protein
MSAARSPLECSPIGDTDFLSELDASFLVPCKRCVSLLRARERFCRFCGANQFIPDEASHAGSAFDPELGSSAGRRAQAPIAVSSVVVRSPMGQEAGGHPIATGAPEQENLEIALVHRGAPWQEKALADCGSARTTAASVARDRVLISIAAALVLLALTPVLEDAHLGPRDRSGELRAVGANVEQVQSAPGHGAFGVAERGWDVLDTRRTDDPGVQTFREAFQRQAREPSMREQLRATPEASEIIRFVAPAAPRVTPTSPLTLATRSPEQPVIAIPAPEARVADGEKEECSEALAALALCPGK